MAAYLSEERSYTYCKDLLWEEYDITSCISPNPQIDYSRYLPLDQIGQEQAEYITQIGGRPCSLNADTISDKVLQEIEGGKYTHVLISPELAISEKFRKTATNPAFIDQLGLVVIDEAHLVREFRLLDFFLESQFRPNWFLCLAGDVHALAEPPDLREKQFRPFAIDQQMRPRKRDKTSPAIDNKPVWITWSFVWARSSICRWRTIAWT